MISSFIASRLGFQLKTCTDHPHPPSQETRNPFFKIIDLKQSEILQLGLDPTPPSMPKISGPVHVLPKVLHQFP